MENKILNDKELENVNGGQAVLPLLSSEENVAVAENFIGSVNRFGICSACGNTVTLPPTGHGFCKCSCGAQVKY